MDPPDANPPMVASLPASFLETLVATSTDAVLVCAMDGTVLYANAQGEDLTGLRRQDLLGQKIQTACPLLPRGVLEEGLAGILSGSSLGCSPVRPVTLRDRSSLPRTCRARFVPLPSADGNGPSAFALHLCEATELFAMQDEVLDLQEQYRTLVDRSTDVIFQIKPNLLVQSVNSAARTVLGYDPSEIVGRRIELPLFLPSEEIRRLRVIGASAVLREGVRNKLFRIHRKNGALFWGLLTLAPIRHGRSIRSILGILRDVSEFYETREQLEAQHAQLRRTVAKLEEAYRLQEQFVANVTHELRTPLTTLLITAELLEKNVGAERGAADRRQVELVHKNAKILLDIINDLLDLAKLKREAFRVSAQEVHLADFFRGLVEEVEPLFTQKKLSLRLDVAAGTPETVRTDPAVLRKIVMNILSNAFKFTQEGGAVLHVSREEDWLNIGVTDTGIGIHSDEIPHIFEEFRQVDGSDSRRYPGTGLGLTIADRFTRLLGGHIEVVSKPQEGSTFSVRLPFRSDRQPPAPAL